ncbi:hypothetical protein WA556_003738, partial [Blastocystis sp. ATCC 50177/Nand II]
MRSVFEGVNFAILPDTYQHMGEDGEKMLSLLNSGGGKECPIDSCELTHVICFSADYHPNSKRVSDSAFCEFVIPKWVLISQSLHYPLSFRSYRSDPFFFFSGEVLFFYNCPTVLYEVYLPLCIHHGAQVITSIMCQCTRIICFEALPNPLPPEVTAYPQIRIVSDRWIEDCLRSGTLVDDSRFLLYPNPLQDAPLIIESPSVNYIDEWKSDISSSIDTLFREQKGDPSTVFRA